VDSTIFWVPAARQSRYALRVSEPKEQVEAIRKLLEAELDRRLQRQWGCWPLVVGVLGVLLGIALLAEIL
jgi:hypothetical protein